MKLQLSTTSTKYVPTAIELKYSLLISMAEPYRASFLTNDELNISKVLVGCAVCGSRLPKPINPPPVPAITLFCSNKQLATMYVLNILLPPVWYIT